jgi:hypothetical protein
MASRPDRRPLTTAWRSAMSQAWMPPWKARRPATHGPARRPLTSLLRIPASTLTWGQAIRAERPQRARGMGHTAWRAEGNRWTTGAHGRLVAHRSSRYHSIECMSPGSRFLECTPQASGDVAARPAARLRVRAGPAGLQPGRCRADARRGRRRHRAAGAAKGAAIWAVSPLGHRLTAHASSRSPAHTHP